MNKIFKIGSTSVFSKVSETAVTYYDWGYKKKVKYVYKFATISEIFVDKLPTKRTKL